MPDTIEAFVGRLQTEGVEAGKQAAARIEAEAEQRAERLLQEAEAQAARIRERAEQEAASYRERVQGDLALAVRDTVRSLRETLSRMLERVLAVQVEESLADSGFLRELIQEVFRQYTTADSEDRGDIEINVTPEMGRQLAHWVVHELREGLEDPARHVDLHAILDKAGFEYSVTSGTVEVTTESVVEVLSALARPELRRILSEVVEQGDESNHGEVVQAGSGTG